MSARELSDDVYRARLQTVVESLRYWRPSVADAARMQEVETPDYWKLTITPRVLGACQLELQLRADRKFDIVVGGELYEDLEMIPLEDFLPLAEAVSCGRVRQRHWVSAATGAVRDIETIVTFADGRVWSRSRADECKLARAARDSAECHDRHFLPYRR